MNHGTSKRKARWWSSFIQIAVLALVTGCSYPNQFQNVGPETPHAILVGKKVTAFHINQQPTSFWRCRERFRIPPGPTTVRAVTGPWDFPEYPIVEFVAAAGYRYTLTHAKSNHLHRILVWARPPGSTAERVVTAVESERRTEPD